MNTCVIGKPAGPESRPANSEGKQQRFLPPPIEVGDRVRTMDGKLGKVISLTKAGFRVQLFTGVVQRYRRKAVTYWPDETTLDARINRVWHSRKNPQLRREMTLPPFEKGDNDSGIARTRECAYFSRGGRDWSRFDPNGLDWRVLDEHGGSGGLS